MKIALFGQFGSGNSGNDGSMESMLNLLRHARPDCELICICSDPDLIEARYNVSSIGITGTTAQRAAAPRWTRFLKAPARKIAALFFLLSSLEGVDILIIPGTGILDDFQEHPFGWPFVVFRWCIAARLRRARVAFVSIGAGPVSRRLSRWFMKLAANSAGYRSYRDAFSRDYVKGLGLDVGSEGLFPDIAFRLPVPAVPPRTPGARLSVGVGVMQYRGWSKDASDATQIYETYIAKMTDFVVWLSTKGHNVLLLTGDVTDRIAMHDIMARIASREPSLLDLVCAGTGGTLQQLMCNILKTDIVVASRYHNVVCALKLGRPTISIGYAQKNLDLLTAFGQQRYSQPIQTFDLAVLRAQFKQIVTNVAAVQQEIETAGLAVQTSLETQEELLLKWCAEPAALRLKRPRRLSGAIGSTNGP
ncbi:polysaccharide pyruvyl transferase family protein [Rhizobium sp. Root482]|uniref:polysaccharide pyruvyl transferase family protein n=1 Tax=Rhizobium sp. Root482 TaxID=1736543 RepID=UPI0006F467EE|nr:polysaccharide pyruvyl transferase family protein [Rhizobium sp. Root482]KQY26660.1 hypothetical protein ASD31_00140 [Rhizobium sp. Root482]